MSNNWGLPTAGVLPDNEARRDAYAISKFRPVRIAGGKTIVLPARTDAAPISNVNLNNGDVVFRLDFVEVNIPAVCDNDAVAQIIDYFYEATNGRIVFLLSICARHGDFAQVMELEKDEIVMCENRYYPANLDEIKRVIAVNIDYPGESQYFAETLVSTGAFPSLRCAKMLTEKGRRLVPLRPTACIEYGPEVVARVLAEPRRVFFNGTVSEQKLNADATAEFVEDFNRKRLREEPQD